MNRRVFACCVAVAAVFAAIVGASVAGAGTGPQVVPDSSLTPSFTTMGGASVLPTTRTVAHWWGSTTDPQNGVTYGYNMVGADPNNCAGACDQTVEADITPIVVKVDGYTFDGSSVLSPTLSSPLFASNDYGSTSAATNSSGSKGKGGALSQDDAGVPLQLEDATMRAQFNQTGSSTYHVRLHPNVQPTVEIDVPQNQGVVRQSVRGVIYADINISWWSSQINNLEQSADATHLPIYLTDNVMLFEGNDPANCCVIGYHGTRAAGSGGGSANSGGNAVVQTFAWASYVEPGMFNPIADWALQDIHALSHEISEWADDPFVNNWVDPWLTPTAPQYGCTNILETGDPVVGIGFSQGTNTFHQIGKMTWTTSAGTFTSQVTDGTYHPEDEVFLPWFMRSAPNTISEPTQKATSNVGRYTLMGGLNPFPGFRAPATGC